MRVPDSCSSIVVAVHLDGTLKPREPSTRTFPSFYCKRCRPETRLSSLQGTPILTSRCPPGGVKGANPGDPADRGREGGMQLIKRIAIAAGSLAALVLASG